jgi:hypothetical protein
MGRKPRRRQKDRGAPLVAAIPPNPGRPDAEVMPPMRLEEIPTTLDDHAAMGLPAFAYMRRYRLGECTVIVTKEYGKWHLSIAHPRRYPSWDEVAQARYRLLPEDMWVAMFLPPPGEYVNLHRNCFQVFECRNPEADEGGEA